MTKRHRRWSEQEDLFLADLWTDPLMRRGDIAFVLDRSMGECQRRALKIGLTGQRLAPRVRSPMLVEAA